MRSATHRASISKALKGHFVSEKTKEKIRQKALGRTISEETKAKILATKIARGTLYSGPDHYNWKGGRTWERFADKNYQLWRRLVLNRDDHACRYCGAEGKLAKLAAHHIKAYETHPDLRLDVNNGLTLCHSCHMHEHGRGPAARVPTWIDCACGCGTSIEAVDKYGRSRSYVNGHGNRGKPMTAETKRKLSKVKKGRKLTERHKLRISIGLHGSSKRIGRPATR